MNILNHIYTILPMSILGEVGKRIEDGNGILITLVGLVAVFLGLVILWGVTSLFPKITARLEGKKESKKATINTAEAVENLADSQQDMAIAIGVALCCDLEDEDISVITLRHIEQDVSPWVVASRPTTMRH